MPLNASDLTIVLPKAELISSLSISTKTETVSRKGLNKVTRTKFLKHETEVSFEGDITSHELIDLLASKNPFNVFINNYKLADFIASDVDISIDDKAPLNFSAKGLAKNLISVTETPQLQQPDQLFVKSEASIKVNNQSKEIISLKLSMKRKVEPIYGGTGSTVEERMKPTSYTIGDWEYTGTIEMPAYAVTDLVRYWLPTEQKWTIDILFTDALNTDKKLRFTLAGVLITNSDADIDPDTVKTSYKFSAESLTIATE